MATKYTVYSTEGNTVADVAVADDEHSDDEHGNAEGAGAALEEEAQNVEHHNKELVL